MLDRETFDRWYAGDPLDSVRYYLNDSVAPKHRPTEFAAVISLESLTPEPQYLIEFSAGNDALMSQSELLTVIYVALLHEGVEVWRPVAAEPLGPDTYRIISPNLNPDIETRTFDTGAEVRCGHRDLEGHTQPVAICRAAT